MTNTPSKIEIVTNKYYVDVNSSRFLDVATEPEDCEAVYVWSVDKPELATVDNVGKVRGKKQGKIVVSAHVKDHPEICSSIELEVLLPVLRTKHLGISFGGLHAVKELNLSIYEGELVGLIGPNGAGKTTAFNLITGVYKATEGSIYLYGESILNKSTHERVKLGVARTFQNIRLFKQMTVIDNVKVAFNVNMKYSPLAGIFRTKKYWKEEAEIEEKAMELLKLLGLEEEANNLASNLPYGKQRKLEIARALASNPKIILLDEPAAGMNPSETDDLMKIIKKIRDTFKISILLIEHDMKLVMGICEKIYVLCYGETIAKGTPDKIAHNQEVIRAYLGTEGE